MQEIFARIGAKTDRFAALRSCESEKQHPASKNPSKSNKSVDNLPVRVKMKRFSILLFSPFLLLVGCSESVASKQRLSLPNLGEWYTVDHNHPVITEAVQGIGRNEGHLVGARVKGEKNLVYYELYSHSPGYPIWKYEVARHRFQIDDSGTLSVYPSNKGYQLLKQTTVDAADIPRSASNMTADSTAYSRESP